MEWLAKVSGIVERIRTPLTLAGLVVLVLYAIYKQILSMDIFSQIDSRSTYQVIDTVLFYLFVLAIVAIVLGSVGYIISRKKPDDKG